MTVGYTSILVFTLIFSIQNYGQPRVDRNLPNYKKVPGIFGNLSSSGSDTMNNLLSFWMEEFRAYYPNVNIQIESKGSGTAPTALISGTAQLGVMSRKMKNEEREQFKEKFGYEPVELKAAIDAIAVFVHKDNPLPGITTPELDAVFSRHRFGGIPHAIETWEQLGLTGAWDGQQISAYGRNSASGTYLFFKEHVLFNGDYKDCVKEIPGSSSVVQGISMDRFGIGYSGAGFRTANVRAVPVFNESIKTFVSPNYDTVINGSYPLSRFLFIYINKAPGKSLDPLIKEFIKYIFSSEGQSAVFKDGLFPLSLDLIQGELQKIE